jgi:DNA processing protein
MNERIECETDRAGRLAMHRLERNAPLYPVQLREIPDAPEVLYVRGRIEADDALAVAVVGSRRATPYGVGVAESLSAELGARGVTVVSGLARGIDSAAHRGALRGGGRTIAVLGCGADKIYPPENRPLAREIEWRGAVVSQFAPGTPALPHHFPIRNRVIAGLALGVVVVEAAERSGALITARVAAELGREVMAVPGRVTSEASRGAHALLRDGAALVETWEDVVRALPSRWQACVRTLPPGDQSSPTDSGSGIGDHEDNRAVLRVVGDEPITMDDVIERSGLASQRVASLLLELELQGRVRQVEGKRFVQVGRG